MEQITGEEPGIASVDDQSTIESSLPPAQEVVPAMASAPPPVEKPKLSRLWYQLDLFSLSEHSRH
jgi:hypothetical protein